MKINIVLGGISIQIESERELFISENIVPFLKNEVKAELDIKVTWDWESFYYPKSNLIGEDLLQKYYYEDGLYYCEAKGGKASVTCTSYDKKLKQMICVINEKPFLQPPKTLDKILSLLPMRTIFLNFSTLFLHASQITIEDKGVVFTAPSGTGKTTQAKLWQTYKDAKIVCNDRTLIRKKEGKWFTYGYPVDGSEPICSGVTQELGCIVLLEQGNYNAVKRINVAQMLGFLLEQTVFDCWNYKDKEIAVELLLQVIQEVPIYKLVCTPDKRAVDELYGTLRKEGVL